METGRVYLQPMEMVYNAMLDMMELQNGTEVLGDPLSGKLYYRVVLYGFMWEFRFTVLSMDNNRCGVTLEIKETENARDDERGYLENMLFREYALLDAMLLLGAPPEVTHSEEPRVQ